MTRLAAGRSIPGYDGAMTWRPFLLPAVAGLAACGGGGGFPDATIDVGPPAPGSFSLAWSVTDTMGNAITCDQIGAQSVTALHSTTLSV